MTARQPRRARRRIAPATSLPRPTGPAEDAEAPAETARLARRQAAGRHHREHHVTRDYSHIHRDLLTVLVIGIITLAFIFGMSFVV